MAINVRYVHKQIDRAVEDTGALDAQSNEIYVIANPGEGLTAIAHPGVANPKAVRDYDAVEFAVEKRFADNWYLRSSYLWSRLYGNYSGLSQSDENGRTSPNVGRLWDYPMMMFKDGGVADLGPLATDRPHQFKTQFIYQFNFGTTVGFESVRRQRTAGDASGSGSIRRTTCPRRRTSVQQRRRDADLLADRPAAVASHPAHGHQQLQSEFNVLDLFNQDTATSRFSIYQKTNGVIPNEDLFYTRPADARTADRQPERREGRALPDGQRVPGADPGARGREVHLSEIRRLSQETKNRRSGGQETQFVLLIS